MVQKAVTMQERAEQLIAGAGANPDGPTLDVAGLQDHVAALNDLAYRVTQAKLALAQAVQTRDKRLRQVTDDVQRAENLVRAAYGLRAPKVKEYVLPGPKPRAAKPTA